MTDDTPQTLGSAVEPYRVTGDLITRGDVRSDLRNERTDSWTSVVADVALLAGNIAPTDFVPKGLRGNAPAVVGAIMYGREVGLPPMTALQVLHNIEGRVSMSSEGQRALVLQAGHEIVTVESSSAKCTMKGRRKGSQEWTQTTWTIDDARAAGLVHKDNWKKYPRAMLVARASADLCRLAFPDVIRGLMAVEELEDVVAIEAGDPASTPAPAEPTKVARKTRKKTTPAPRAETPEEPLPEEETQTGAGSDEGRTDAGEAPTDATEPAPPKPAEDTPPPRQDDGAAEATPPADAAAPSLPEDGGTNVDADGIVEAEIIEDEPVSTEPPIEPAQRTRLIMQFQRLEVGDREERLYTCGVLVGRKVGSANDLTMKEAHRILNVIEGCKDRDALEAAVTAADEANSEGA